MAAKQTNAGTALFKRVREFIKRYAILPTETDYQILALWCMGTWTFSPSSPARPFSYPYLYITGGKGSGKTTVAKDVMSYLCRNHEFIVQVTGAALFRMIGTYDEESGEVIPHYPTLVVDEVDAVYASGGSNDENLRGVGNSGYKQGATVPRSAGKTTIRFPVYCPKAWVGIDNGRLPDTLTDRCIRIDLQKHSQEELKAAGIQYPYPWKVEQESAEIKQALSDWAKTDASMILRDYDPKEIDGLSGRQWELCRPLVQLGRAAKIESTIRAALKESMSRNPEKPDHIVAMFQSIADLFTETSEDQLTAPQILARLQKDGVYLPAGESTKALNSVLKARGIEPRLQRLPEGHSGIRLDKRTGEPQPVQRAYDLYRFDDAFSEMLDDEDDD